MNLDELTLGQIKQLQGIFNLPVATIQQSNEGLNDMIGAKVIIRTYSAGVWFGELKQKSGNEVILKNARRMYRWWAVKGISLSAVALYGVKHKESKIVEAVDGVWLEAIEIIPCTCLAIKSIEEAPNVEAE